MGGVLEWPSSLTSPLKIEFSIKNDGCRYLLFNNEPVTCFAKEDFQELSLFKCGSAFFKEC